MADEAAPQTGQTYLQRLRQGEQHALWKLSLRALICVLDIIGIGTSAWVLTNALRFDANPYIGYFSGAEVSPWALAVCSASLIFCLVCMLVLLLRRPPKPAHPGVAVGGDLVLWLAFIGTALFTTAAMLSLATFGDNADYLDDPGYSSGDYSGNYYLARDNNTWIYNVTAVYTSSGTTSSSSGYGGYFWNSTRDDWQHNTTRPPPASVTRDCTPAFATCAEQDAYINMLWRSKGRRYAAEVAAGAVQWLNVLLHFALFVWACVDTHRCNASVRKARVNAVADRVIQDMQARGPITVHAGARAGPEGQSLMRGDGAGGGGGAAVTPSAER